MLDEHVFFTWPGALVAASCFAGLFALVVMMSELVAGGAFRLSPGGAALAAAAFVGYLGVAALVRRERGPEEGA